MTLHSLVKQSRCILLILGTHFPNGVSSSKLNIVICFALNLILRIQTRHDSWPVVTGAKLWSDLTIIFIKKTVRVLQDLGYELMIYFWDGSGSSSQIDGSVSWFTSHDVPAPVIAQSSVVLYFEAKFGSGLTNTPYLQTGKDCVMKVGDKCHTGLHMIANVFSSFAVRGRSVKWTRGSMYKHAIIVCADSVTPVYGNCYCVRYPCDEQKIQSHDNIFKGICAKISMG